MDKVTVGTTSSTSHVSLGWPVLPIYSSLFSDIVLFLKAASLPVHFHNVVSQDEMTPNIEVWEYTVSDKTILSSMKFNNKQVLCLIILNEVKSKICYFIPDTGYTNIFLFSHIRK